MNWVYCATHVFLLLFSYCLVVKNTFGCSQKVVLFSSLYFKREANRNNSLPHFGFKIKYFANRSKIVSISLVIQTYRDKNTVESCFMICVTRLVSWSNKKLGNPATWIWHLLSFGSVDNIYELWICRNPATWIWQQDGTKNSWCCWFVFASCKPTHSGT